MIPFETTQSCNFQMILISIYSYIENIPITNRNTLTWTAVTMFMCMILILSLMR